MYYVPVSFRHPFTAAIVLLLSALAAAAVEKKAAPAVDDVDLLQLDMKMARFLVKHVSSRMDPKTRAHDLMDAVFSEKGLGITYEDMGTKTAVETFKSRSGNCLSFTVLFVAMARHLGLDAYFLEVGEVMSWDRRGDIVLRNHHMLVEIEIENGSMNVDFLPGGEKRYRKARRVGDRRVLAHYYNNVGAEILTTGDDELARAYFERALEVDPKFAHAWTNLGVAWRHLGDFERAEQSYLEALEIDGDESTAITNLASLYIATGRRDEAEPLLERVNAHLRSNPFHHYRLGAKALSSGDAAAAVRRFRDAIRRQGEEGEFHAALARALAETGDVAKARTSLERALELAESEEQRQHWQAQLEALGEARR